ncbi:ABC transporter substrate-binding protein [Microbacterium sp. 18062]|uniref:ABC transporter substrate-binding protein n=1 Tax=Microbacterium sp. 18062 TaxID=2681410 RepID=UPI00135BEE94|nr:ABC transporter substrate-binding protein [Microbacterium sp. 18062]
MSMLRPAARRCAALTLAGVTVLALAGCGNSRSGGDEGSGDVSGATGAGFVDTSACPAEALASLADGAPIKVGLSLPLSGPLAPVGALVQAGAQAVADRVNDDGGVDGHDIELVARDNGLDPAREISNAQELIGQEEVFLLANEITTSIILAAQQLAADTCTPQVNAITTNLEIGDAESNPWTIVGIAPADAEAVALTEWLAAERPGATIMEIRQDNELGADFSLTFAERAEAQGLTVLEPETVSPVATTYDPQIATLVTSGADAVLAEIQGPACSTFLQGLAQAGWEGITMVSSACNGAKQYFIPIGADGDGVVAPFYTVDPGDPANADDPRLAAYFADMAEYQPQADPYGSNALDGYGGMEWVVAALEQAAASDAGLTRASLMNALWDLELTRDYYLRPEQRVDADAGDPYILDYIELRRYDVEKGGWQDTGVSIEYTRS